MKIHPHPPLIPPLPQPPKPPTPVAVAVKTEELIETAQQQRARLKKLFGARKNKAEPEDDRGSQGNEAGTSSNRILDVLA
jgi:hypothetical protein